MAPVSDPVESQTTTASSLSRCPTPCTIQSLATTESTRTATPSVASRLLPLTKASQSPRRSQIDVKVALRPISTFPRPRSTRLRTPPWAVSRSVGIGRKLVYPSDLSLFPFPSWGIFILYFKLYLHDSLRPRGVFPGAPSARRELFGEFLG
jgi:hypothetical protein